MITLICYAVEEFEKWRAIRASVGGVRGVLTWMVWVTCLRRWDAIIIVIVIIEMLS